MKSGAIVLSLLVILLSPNALFAQSALDEITCRNLMTEAEFKACGLTKLTALELRMLDKWLQGHTVRVAQIFQNNEPTRSTQSSSVIRSHISGTFTGWTGSTVFELDNGQIWKQAAYSYTYHYAYHPRVLIYESDGVWNMQVEGVSQELVVVRIK